MNAGISWNAKSESVPHSVYIVFIVLQICSLGFAFFLLPTRDLIRSDGTPIAVHDRPTVKDTLKQTGRLFKDWRIWIMIPCFFTPEVFFPFQASMNAYVFNLRTRTLNSLLNNLIQIPTCFAMGYILDNQKIGSRRKRLLIAIAADAVWITGAYIAQTAWLASWKFDRSIPGPMIDCTDPAYAGAVVIYMLYAARKSLLLRLPASTLTGFQSMASSKMSLSTSTARSRTTRERLLQCLVYSLASCLAEQRSRLV